MNTNKPYWRGASLNVAFRHASSMMPRKNSWIGQRWNTRRTPTSHKRLETSFASARLFFGDLPVSLIDAGRLDAFKVWRTKEHKVRPVTLRHDLHALSTFFAFAIKQRWARDNPVRNVGVPSDADATKSMSSRQEKNRNFSSGLQSSRIRTFGTLRV